MRTLILTALLFTVISASAQSYLPGSFIDMGYRGNFANNIHLNDSASKKKWFVSKYSGISTSFSFFKGGNATVVSAPLGLQLNRTLNNNLYAFAGVSVAPAYVNFNSSLMNPGFNKLDRGNTFNSRSLGIYSRAELGLMYVNDERTFSISGSIGVERNDFPMRGFTPLNSNNQIVYPAK
ncbi:MAG: hypothetical protein JWQ40_1742 [Segetibacter sp.]|nr:hypothetical protein [Segetibacter sp.]